MQKASNLQDFSREELLARKKKLTKLLVIFAVFNLLLDIVLFYVAIKKGNYALLAVAFASVFPMLPVFLTISAIDKELKGREKDKDPH